MKKNINVNIKNIKQASSIYWNQIAYEKKVKNKNFKRTLANFNLTSANAKKLTIKELKKIISNLKKLNS